MNAPIHPRRSPLLRGALACAACAILLVALPARARSPVVGVRISGVNF